MPIEKILKTGAEAQLIQSTFLGEKILIKHRLPKNYRNTILDQEIRKSRTKMEARMIHEAKRLGILTPSIRMVDQKNMDIVMEFIPGHQLKKELQSNLSANKKLKFCFDFGKEIGKLHTGNFIHGDLTTSNVMVQKDKLILIDFGLAFYSSKIEDKAVDLLNLKKTFSSTHYQLAEGWEKVCGGYESTCSEGKKVVEHISTVERRARYS